MVKRYTNRLRTSTKFQLDVDLLVMNRLSKFPNIAWELSVWFRAIDVVSSIKSQNLVLDVNVGEAQFSQCVEILLPLNYIYSSLTDYLLEITEKLVYIALSGQDSIRPFLFLSAEYYHMINLSNNFII